jgi:hypothetical protein
MYHITKRNCIKVSIKRDITQRELSTYECAHKHFQQHLQHYLSQHLQQQQQHLQQQIYNITCNDNAKMIGYGCFVGQNSYNRFSNIEESAEQRQNILQTAPRSVSSSEVSCNSSFYNHF